MGFTRREALISGSITLAALFAEIYGRPVGKLLESISGPEGNPAQRYAILTKLIQSVAQYPQKPLPKQILKSWILMNLAERYAHNQEWPIASSNICHFLYGNGEKIDLTDPLIDSATNSNKSDNPTPIADFADKCINDVPITSHDNSYQIRYSFGKRLITLTSSVTYPDLNIYFGLGVFGFKITGETQEFNPINSRNALIIHNPKISIFDDYNWDKENLAGFSLTPDEAKQSFKQLFHVSPPPVITEIFSANEIGIDSKDGWILEQTGYGQGFPIFSRPIKCERPIAIPIAN
jgi:hypothetical protein